jgi:hypothetical protein
MYSSIFEPLNIEIYIISLTARCWISANHRDIQLKNKRKSKSMTNILILKVINALFAISMGMTNRVYCVKAPKT